jgi:hypothetical protein
VIRLFVTTAAVLPVPPRSLTTSVLPVPPPASIVSGAVIPSRLPSSSMPASEDT